jgi:ABC-type transport system involved in multi-copper enzyme maturation permease subunit
MLFHMIKKEILLNVLSARFLVTYGLLFCLIVLSVALMSGEYAERYQDYSAEVIKERDAIDVLQKIDDPSKQFQELQRSPLYSARQPRNLGILARGVEGSLPTRVASNAFGFFGSSETRLNRDVLSEIFQAPDFAYVINVVVSLLAMLFVFDAISGEKERGTLKLLLANSVPRDTVILSKWIGGYLSIIVPFSIAVLGGFVYVYVTGSLDLSGDGGERFLLIYVVSLLYVSTFFSLGLMISSITQRNATALLLSLMVWIGWILIIPNIAPVVAGLLSHAPSRQAIEAEIRVIEEEYSLLAQTGSRSRNFDQADRQRLQTESEERKHKLEKFYQDKTQTQIELGKNLARLSPSACSLFAMTRLAGTGPILFDQFHQAIVHYQDQHRQYMQGFYSSDKIEWGPTGMTMKDPNWFHADDLPHFRIYEESLSASLDAALPDLLLVLMYNVIFFLLAYVFFMRYDVT